MESHQPDEEQDQDSWLDDPYAYLSPHFDDTCFVRTFHGDTPADAIGKSVPHEAYAPAAGELMTLWLQDERETPEQFAKGWECPVQTIRELLMCQDRVDWRTRGDVARGLAQRFSLDERGLYFGLSTGLAFYRLRMACRRGELTLRRDAGEQQGGAK